MRRTVFFHEDGLHYLDDRLHTTDKSQEVELFQNASVYSFSISLKTIYFNFLPVSYIRLSAKQKKQYQYIKLKYSDILIEREKAGNKGYCSECITFRYGEGDYAHKSEYPLQWFIPRFYILLQLD